MKRYDFEDFCKIIQCLREKDGCPWDREQTHKSLKSCMIEEAYEVLEGIDQYEETGDYDNLREELGDVLLQVVMHAQIAREEGLFAIDDVIQEISVKMIRRHPHVFGGKFAKDTDEVLNSWEEIKKQEKKENNILNDLSNIPKSFPGLLRAQKVQNKAEKLYHTKHKTEEIFESSRKLLDRLEAVAKSGEDKKNSVDMQKMLGGLFFQIVKIAGKLGIDAEESISLVINSFINEFENT